jgi:hypothetical protein
MAVPRSLSDITSQLVNLRENLPEDRVKHVAAFRAEKWRRLAGKLEEKCPESGFIDAHRQRSANWAEVAAS